MSYRIRDIYLATSRVVCSNRQFASAGCLAVVAVTLLGQLAEGASITFSGPVAITSDAILDQPGTIVHAGRWAGTTAPADIVVVTPAATVITFSKRGASSTIAASGTDTMLFGTYTPLSDAGFFNATGTTVSAAFESALDNFGYGDGAESPDYGTLRVGSLSSGQQYELQLFFSDDRAGGGSSSTQFGENSDKSGNITTAAALNSSPSYIASFTADAAIQDVYVFGYTGVSNNGYARTLNAYVLRAVPEPSTGSLIFLGSIVLMQLRRRMFREKKSIA